MEKEQAIAYVKEQVQNGKDRETIILELTELLNAPQTLTTRFVDSVLQTLPTEDEKKQEQEPMQVVQTQANIQPTEAGKPTKKRNSSKVVFVIVLLIGIAIMFFSGLQALGLLASAYGIPANFLFLFGIHLGTSITVASLLIGLILTILGFLRLVTK